MRRAFSLTELVIVMSTVAVMAGIALPRVGTSVANHRAEMAAERVIADLRLAQMWAKASRSSVTVTFNQTRGTLTIDRLESLNDPAATYVTDFSDAPYRAVMTRATFGGDAEIIFDGYGGVDSGGGVALKVGGTERQVRVDAASGEASIIARN